MNLEIVNIIAHTSVFGSLLYGFVCPIFSIANIGMSYLFFREHKYRIAFLLLVVAFYMYAMGVFCRSLI